MSFKLVPSRVYANNLNNDEYYWRYMDIHKFMSMVFTRSVFVSRFDSVEDVNEGMSQIYLMRKLFENKDNVLDGMYADSDLHEYDLTTGAQRLQNRQKQLFMSCWFRSKRESVGMWHLYAKDGGMLVRVSSDTMKHFTSNMSVTPVANKDMTIFEQLSIFDYTLGDVHYVDFTDERSVRQMKDVTMALGYHKDVAYAHESEFRFTIKVKDKNRLRHEGIEIYGFNAHLPEGFEFECRFHPKMEEWQKQNIRTMLQPLNITPVDSELELR